MSIISRALMATIAHCTEPMVLTDPHSPDHPMVAVNGAFEALTGYPASETLGRNCRFLQGSGTDPATKARLRGHLAAHRGCVEWIVNYRRDGSMFWNLLFLTPVFGRDGELLHYLGNQRDITRGVPVALPDYVLGRADVRLDTGGEFHGLLLELLDEKSGLEASARQLERLIEAARELDRMTTQPRPAPWEIGRAHV